MIKLRDTTSPNIIHYSSWKVNFNPIWINSVSSNSLKFAKMSQILNYEIYVFIYIKKLLDRVLVLTCSVSKDLPGCRTNSEWTARLNGDEELSWTSLTVSCPLFSFMEFSDKNILGILFLFRVGHCVFADSLMTKITFIEWKKQTINLRDS